MSLFSKNKYRIVMKQGQRSPYEVYKNTGLIFEGWEYDWSYDTLPEAIKRVDVLRLRDEKPEVVKTYQ